MLRLNNDWKFIYDWDDSFLTDISEGEAVRLPHNVTSNPGGFIPLHYASPEDYSTVCGYGRELLLTEEQLNGRLFLQFDGAAHIAEVFVNALPAAKHFGGYTAFRAEITDLVHAGSNLITVRLDCTENPETPPFGHVIDYLTYGGIYRDVWLDERPASYIEDAFVYTLKAGPENVIRVRVNVSGPSDSCSVSIYDPDGNPVISGYQLSNGALQDTSQVFQADIEIPGARLWSPDDPSLYRLEAKITSGDCTDTDERCFGIRTCEFRSDGFYLNGERFFLRGLNRHQSFPYIGYGATERLQREDARILKEELGCSAVRTSHYPQSRYFIDECDRLGLLVFTEIAGWQHIGGDSWKEHEIDTLREMVIQYRNHPSIILWGVRVNESVDDDSFYKKTNDLAHVLDPSRQTSGVRYLEKSHLLEDVYAFNDFSHDGSTPGCRKKKDITPDTDKAYLISECNGHMYPTKPFDSWSQRQEQALRHARVINSAISEGDIAGVFGWCMFDYQTHQDFGSGDRICYHGVMDMFRNPKTAAYLYASQADDDSVLEIGSSFDIGDYPGGSKGSIYAFTNADEIRLYKNDRFVKSFTGRSFTSLPHSPVLIDDTIGDLIYEEFDQKEGDLIRTLLLSAGKHGFEHMPLKDKLKLLYAHFRYNLSFEQGYALFGKYMGGWGDESVIWRFDAVKEGNVIKSVTKSPSETLRIEARATSLSLTEGDCQDMAMIRIRVVDENGNTAPYAQLPLSLTAEGAIELAGPDSVTAEGGMCGTVIRTVGRSGTGVLRISSSQAGEALLEFTVQLSFLLS